MCEAGGLRESVARPESKNSNSLIGLEWHQTMAKYIIKRKLMLMIHGISILET